MVPFVVAYDISDNKTRKKVETCLRNYGIRVNFSVFECTVKQKNIKKKETFIMNTQTFESKLLPSGHLYCPKEFTQKKNIYFKVIVIFEDLDVEASKDDIELSNITDISHDVFSNEEINYYLNLEEI